MFCVKNVGSKGVSIFLLLMLVVFASSCSSSTATANLPKDVLGISIDMSKDDAERRLREIGKFSRNDVKRQQVWSVRDNPHFGYIAIGFDRENRVSYVSAIAKIVDGKPMRFAEVGDIKTAKAEIVGANHRYEWEVPARDGSPPHSVIVLGNNADNLSMLTLAKFVVGKEEDEEERSGKEEGK